MRSGKNVHFPPVANGMDYLRSVLDHLDDNPTHRDLKYTVLHLQAATEVLLKARLIEADWRLVWANPDMADEAKFERGEFQSCGIDDAIARLRNTGVEISPQAKGEITNLAKLRNQLQHFGLTASATAIEARAATVLDFLLDFVQRYLRPGLGDDDATIVDEQMTEFWEALTGIRSLIEARMKRIEPLLRAATDRTVTCPDCGLMAMVASGAPSVECLVCGNGKTWDPKDVADEYASTVLGLSWYVAIKDGGAEPVYTCPECDLVTLVRGALLAGTPDIPADFCFNCAEQFTGVAPCQGGCGTLTDSDTGLCFWCERQAFSRF